MRQNAVAALAPAYGGSTAKATAAIVGNGGRPDMTAGQFLWDVYHGDEDPQGVGDWLHGIMHGPAPRGAGR